MKTLSIYFFLLGTLFFVACKDHQQSGGNCTQDTFTQEKVTHADELARELQKQKDEEYLKQQADSLKMVEARKKEEEYYRKNFKKISLKDTIGSRTLEDYLADAKISRTFKNVFQQKQGLNDDWQTLALIDSLFSDDTSRHPFYFVLVTRTMWWSDGAFSEPLGMSAKDYVEKNSRQFLTYFRTEKVLTEADLRNWAQYVAMEMAISSDEDFNKSLAKLKSKMKKGCSDCSPEDIELMNKFIKLVSSEWDKLG